MFCRQGRNHVQEWLGFLQGHAQLFALVPVFQDGQTLEANVKALRDAGKVDPKATGIRWCQGDYLYCGDVGLLFLAARDKDCKAFRAYLDELRNRFNQAAYILVENGNAILVEKDKTTPLATTFSGNLENLDELTGHLIPGWRTEGNFDRSISYVRMRDHMTRPRPSRDETPTGTEGA
jgi:hypothetical protein